MHAATLKLPAATVEMPIGQAVQLAELAATYEPTAHVVQPAAAAVPLPVTVPAEPGAQIVHAVTSELPAAEPVV